jgi:hypothetical protein
MDDRRHGLSTTEGNRRVRTIRQGVLGRPLPDTIWLASRGSQVTAVDIAPTALRRAREQVQAASPKLNFRA